MSERNVVLFRWLDPRPGQDGVWTSPLMRVGFPATEAIPSWNATTTGFLRIEIRAEDTKWYRLGDWAPENGDFKRTSVKGQDDADGQVRADILAFAHPAEAVQVRVTLNGPGSLRSVHLMASDVLPGSAPSAPEAARGRVLDVPAYSQLVHAEGGGWCSAASTAMVLAYWGAGPGPDELDESNPDPAVVHAAEHVYDWAYGGCGNWPFNTAYAGRFGLRGFVTRLRSLNEAERFIEAGIPLVVSASHGREEVPGLDYETEGHLTVLAGFTGNGDPVLNDPNSPTNADVRKAVGRAEWEAAWLRSSRGIVYVIHPASVPLPEPPVQTNW